MCRTPLVKENRIPKKEWWPEGLIILKKQKKEGRKGGEIRSRERNPKSEGGRGFRVREKNIKGRKQYKQKEHFSNKRERGLTSA